VHILLCHPESSSESLPSWGTLLPALELRNVGTTPESALSSHLQILEILVFLLCPVLKMPYLATYIVGWGFDLTSIQPSLFEVPHLWIQPTEICKIFRIFEKIHLY
jgi:hypothetical protein